MEKGSKLHGFTILDIQDLTELSGRGIFAKHDVTGLEVFHIETKDEENLFAYAFMTPPEDSTGVAHILEHSVLCGSKNYPLKDPFLILAKQSVKTFLNAMTFPDKTVYPASSMVEADYFNLMSVYGDAVFFPLLEKWVFEQEGHRFEIGDDGKTSIQGVVFNEMRGNYSSFDSIAGDWSLRSLMQGTPYEHDSGGNPKDIPSLTYEQFLNFHKVYYHPVNCKVFLSGNIATERQLELLQNKFLCHFTSAQKPSLIAPVSLFSSPKFIEVTAPSDENHDPERVTVLLNYLLPEATDTITLMEANLITELLLGHDGSPLSKALLESGLGEDIAPSSGLETEIRHLCFCVGLRGVQKSKVKEFENLIHDTISSLIENLIPESEIQAAIRSIDFSNREIRRSGGPFTLTLMRRSLRGWIHGKGPVATLRYVPAFEEVKNRVRSDTSYIYTLIKRWFIENNHRSTVVVVPDPAYDARLDQQLSVRIEEFNRNQTEESRSTFLDSQKAFFQKQKMSDSSELLSRIPHISKNDLPLVADSITTTIETLGSVPVLLHEQPTNDISYIDIAFSLASFEADEYLYLPLFASVLTGMGVDGLDWVETSSLCASVTGGLGSMLFTSSMVSSYTPDHRIARVAGQDLLIIRVKMLSELTEKAVELLFNFIEKADFSDTKRLTDLVFEYRNDLDSSIAPAGHQYAISRSASTSGHSKAVDEIWNGLTQLFFVRTICKSLRKKKFVTQLSSKLSAMRTKIQTSAFVINCTGSESDIIQMKNSLSPYCSKYTNEGSLGKSEKKTQQLFSLINKRKAKTSSRELIYAAVQVGFASAVLPSAPYGSMEQAVEIVFGHWLSSGLLWEKVRTAGGAYGVFSYPDSLENIFVFSSYRDPSPMHTLDVFQEALEIACLETIDNDSLEKTITGCYSREVQPRSPSDKGFTAFIRILFGITDEIRKQRISKMLSVTSDDLQACAKRLLGDWARSEQAILAGKNHFSKKSSVKFTGKLRKIKV